MAYEDPEVKKFQREWYEWSSSENIESLTMALSEGQDINEIVLNGLTAASIAALKGKMRLFDFLRSNGADFYKEDGNKMNALMCSAHAGTVKIAAKILSRGDPEKSLAVCNEDGLSPLHFAAKSGRAEMVQFLISKGADVNAKDCLGNTPLHLSMLGSSPLAVTMLINAGAESLENNEGQMPNQIKGALAACKKAYSNGESSSSSFSF